MSCMKEMLVALVVILGITVVAHTACHCEKEPIPTPTPDTETVTTSTATMKLAPPEKKVWEVVEDLTYAERMWGSKDEEEGWADISSRKTTKAKGEKWTYPYPWHLVLHPPWSEHVYDCAFHEGLEGGDAGLKAWRVAWCEGGDLAPGRRHAKRLVLHRRETEVKFLLINIDGLPTVELDSY